MGRNPFIYSSGVCKAQHQGVWILQENICCLKVPSSLFSGVCLTCVCPHQVTSPWNVVGLRLRALGLNTGALSGSLLLLLPQHSTWVPLAGLPVPGRPWLLATCHQPLPHLPCPSAHRSSPIHYPNPFCFSPSADLQRVPINNFKRSPNFPSLRQ